MSQREDNKATDSLTPGSSPELDVLQNSNSNIKESTTQDSLDSESTPFLETRSISRHSSSSLSSSSTQKSIFSESKDKPLSVETKITIFKKENKTLKTTPKSSHSIVKFYNTQKQKFLVTNKLVITLQNVCEQKTKAMESFLEFTEKLMLIENDLLSKVLTETTSKISNKYFAELERFLNIDLKKITNAIIDTLHTRTDDYDEQKIKSIVHRNIIAISLLEKILFPRRPFRYCQQLVFVGFSLAEKTQLGEMLQKIDSTFNVKDWLRRWAEGNTPFEDIIIFDEHNSIEDHTNRRCCCCC